jgi:hypothetical protein
MEETPMRTLLSLIAFGLMVVGFASAPVTGSALAKHGSHESHSHQAAKPNHATKADDCAAQSWEIPTQQGGAMPETTAPCMRHGANPKTHS